MSSHEFPSDLYPDLLSRLPTKTLLKVKSVSKLWLSIIKDPKFSSMHANRLSDSSSTTQICLRFVGAANQMVSKICETNCRGEVAKVLRPLPDEISNKYPTLVGSSNGVLCFVYKDLTSNMEIVVLWNPLSKQYQRLPPLPHVWGFQYKYGFGYDNVNNDYKVLCFESSRSRRVSHTTRAMIYSRKLNAWRTTSLVKFPNSILVYNYGVLYGGSLHWLSRTDHAVIDFDLSTEEFKRFSQLSPEYWEFVRRHHQSANIIYYDVEKQLPSCSSTEASDINDGCCGEVFPYIQTLEFY